MTRGDRSVTIVDASFSSPLHLLLAQLEGVLCLTPLDREWTPAEKEVLLALRDSCIPIWGVTQSANQVFPLL